MPITWLAFSPDGGRILTASTDRTIKLRDTIDGRELLTLARHPDEVWGSTFTADGRRIVAGCDTGDLVVWDSASEAEVAAFAGERSHETLQPRSPAALDPSGTPMPNWLVLGPTTIEAGRSLREILDHPWIAGESEVRPRAGEIGRLLGRDYAWHPIETTDSVLDFGRRASPEGPASALLAVCYLQTPGSLSHLVLEVDIDQPAVVFLNGIEVHRSFPTCLQLTGEDLTHNRIAEIDLHAGINTLVLKMARDGGGWSEGLRASLRIRDAAGFPVPGLSAAPTAAGPP